MSSQVSNNIWSILFNTKPMCNTISMDKVLSVYYQNCRGLRTKLHTLYMNILMYDYDLILLSETWLTNDIFDNEFIDSRYHVYRCDRNRAATGRKDGGGVLIAAHRSLAAAPLALPLSHTNSTPMPPIIDIVLVELLTATGRHIFGVTYIPPNETHDTYLFYFNYLHDMMLLNDNIHLVGDYNIASLNWTRSGTHMEPLLTNNNCLTTQSLYQFMTTMNLTQYNCFENHNGHILDLFLSSAKDCIISSASTTLVPPDGHHPPFYVLLSFANKSHIPINTQNSYCYKNADYTIINEEILNTDWEKLFHDKTANEAVDAFYEIIYGFIRKFIPSKVIKPQKFPAWFNSSLIHIFKDKKRAWIKWKKYNNISDYEIFCVLRLRFKKESKIRYEEYMSLVEDSIKINTQNFWIYFSNVKNNSRIPRTVFYKNNLASNPIEACNLFSDFFYSVFVPSELYDDFDLNNIKRIDEEEVQGDIINHIIITTENVLKALKSLDATKGPGLDDIPPMFFKSTAVNIYKPLHILFNICLKEGIFPNKWKMARIVPIHKGGTMKNVENYRPISILPILAKLLERLIHDAIYPLLHRIIIPQQHGFVQRRSTVTNLLVFSSQLFENLDNNRQTDSIYTDFQKAFDRVDHKRLLEKLAFNGIRGDLWRWFKSYITNRTQRVVISGHESKMVVITSGVPQGSILAPLLFILFINDIHKCFKYSNFLLYADDLKIFKTIESPDDHNHLQTDLTRFTNYCADNKLNLNLNKCKHITFTKKKIVSKHTYTLCGENLEKVNNIKDLGITLDSKLRLDIHIQTIVKKAFKMYGFIMRTGNNFKRVSTFLHLYKSLVRSQLEYAVCIWNPYYDNYVKSLESVQKKFLRRMHYKFTRSYLSYEQLLEKYNILDLQSRRKQLEAMLLFDLCHNKYDCNLLTRKLCFKVPFRSHTRSNQIHKLFAPTKCRTNAGERAPLWRMTQSYNSCFSTVDIFATRAGAFRKLVVENLKKSIN